MEGKNRGYLIAIIVAVVVIAGIIFYYSYQEFSSASNPTTSGNNGNGVNTATSRFSDSRFYKNSYIISDDTLSAQSQNALSGFSYSKTVNSDGSVNITLKAINPEYSDQSYIVQPGQKLYFIENSFGDDSPPNGENSLMDDHAILVDSNGNIVSQR